MRELRVVAESGVPMMVPGYVDAGAVTVSILLPAAVGLLLALIPASIARNKGHSYGGYYLFGLFCFLPALIVALIIQPAGGRATATGRIRCPRCGESIAAGAVVCRFCNFDLPAPSAFDVYEVEGVEEYEYVCEPCDLSFEQRSGLKRHLHEVHGSTGSQADAAIDAADTAAE